MKVCIEVTCCEDCPYYSKDPYMPATCGYGSMYAEAFSVGGGIQLIDNADEIPGWCPIGEGQE